jgi:hypothetical protein
MMILRFLGFFISSSGASADAEAEAFKFSIDERVVMGDEDDDGLDSLFFCEDAPERNKWDKTAKIDDAVVTEDPVPDEFEAFDF